MCPHAACDRGWIDNPDGSTRPCSRCREELAAAVLPTRSRAELRWALAAHRGDRVPAV